MSGAEHHIPGPAGEPHVHCNWCQDMVPEKHATSYDISADDEYYPKIRWICDICKRRWFETDDIKDTDRERGDQ